MRVLFARAGIPYSPFTGKPITSQTVSQIVDKIKELQRLLYIYLLQLLEEEKVNTEKKCNFKKRGFRKIKIDETLYDIENVPELIKR